MLFTLFLSTLALAADSQPQEGFFLLVGGNEKQMEACPSPVMFKKDSLKTGAFLKAVYPEQKITVEKAAGSNYQYAVGGRSVSITLVSSTELQWNEKALASGFTGKLCQKAGYAPNSASQEELDSMIKDEEIQDEKPAEKSGKALKTAPKAKGRPRSKF